MTIRGAFIGIDRYVSNAIRDLSGASRDAKALWALFSDTIPAQIFTLLSDGKATYSEVSSLLKSTLTGAQCDDVVIVTFSGHGTHEGSIVCHDTDPEKLTDTSISVQYLADLFRESSARVVLCILDCCFSGTAPARVFEASPIPRSHANVLSEVAGRGRLFLSASSFDEPAWEHPGHRHGLLTKAILDCLRESEGGISLPTSLDDIMQRVRVEAARLGKTQTPVLYGLVEGGITLPALKPGAKFREAFPEYGSALVDTKLESLGAFGIPAPVIAEWQKYFKDGLNTLQVRAVNETRVLDGASAVVVAPTSAGKTFIGELAACKALADGRRAVFLLPYKALASEKYDQFERLYGQTLGWRIVRCTGDYADQTTLLVQGKYELALLTYEMYLNLMVTNPSILTQVGLVVVDEAQFITDPGRGITVELIFTYLLTARAQDIAPQVICLSAVIGDVNNLDQWLNATPLISYDRPVPLTEGVLNRSGLYRYLDEAGKERHEQLLDPHTIVQRRDKPSAQDVIVPLAKKLLSEGEKILVFRNQRGKAEGAAAYLAKDLQLPSAHEALDLLPEYDLSSTSTVLRQCLAGGTAFHNSNLKKEEKVVVEQAFRDPASNVRVLAATTTVAAGINTPASTVILAESEFVGEDGRKFTVAEYKNMAGRAGRVGFNEQGKAILIAANDNEASQLFGTYVRGSLERIQSTFNPKQLDTWIVRLLAQVPSVPKSEVVHLLLNTYGGYCANKANSNWRAIIEQALGNLLKRMLELGLLEEENERVQLSLLGRACGQSALSFVSAMRLVELIKKLPAGTATPSALVAIVQALPESDSSYTPMFRKGTKESVRPSEASQRFGAAVIMTLQNYAPDMFAYYARCKRAAIMHDWITGVPVEKIEKRYTVTPFQGKVGYGDIRGIADTTRFYLRSASQIAQLLVVNMNPHTESLDDILRRLEVGLPSEALPLLNIPFPLERGEYLQLRASGVLNESQFQGLAGEQLREILGKSRAKQIERLRNVTQTASEQ